MASEQRAAQGSKERFNLFVFLKEARSELRKVIWPNRKDTISYTLVVCVAVVLSTLFIWGVDIVFAKGLGLLLK